MAIHPRTVLITGASTGIGAACALYLDARGFRVLAGVRNLADGDALRVRSSSRLTPVQLDVTDRDSLLAGEKKIRELVGETGLGGLVNNAGIAVGGPLEVLPLDDLRRQFEVNVVGMLAVTQALLPLLRQARGRIVNIGSIAGRTAVPFVGAYSMSKSAVAAMTTALRLELDTWGIDVSLVEPGAIATPIWQKSTAAADAFAGDPLYSKHIANIRRAVGEAERHAISADAVARAVEHALTARRPKTRYLVGVDARIRAGVAALLPQRMQDALQRWYFKLPGRR